MHRFCSLSLSLSLVTTSGIVRQETGYVLCIKVTLIIIRPFGIGAYWIACPPYATTVRMANYATCGNGLRYGFTVSVNGHLFVCVFGLFMGTMHFYVLRRFVAHAREPRMLVMSLLYLWNNTISLLACLVTILFRLDFFFSSRSCVLRSGRHVGVVQTNCPISFSLKIFLFVRLCVCVSFVYGSRAPVSQLNQLRSRT